jgi:hypothetical protein
MHLEGRTALVIGGCWGTITPPGTGWPVSTAHTARCQVQIHPTPPHIDLVLRRFSCLLCPQRFSPASELANLRRVSEGQGTGQRRLEVLLDEPESARRCLRRRS